MRLTSLFVALAAAATVVVAQAGYGGGGGGYGGGGGGYGGGGGGGGYGSGGGGSGGGPGDDDGPSDDGGVATSTTSSAAAASSSSSSSSARGTTGKTCTNLMCITAIVNSTTTTYELQQSTSSTLGWMAIGFGQTMANSPMVILWPSGDGNITLSQRHASAEIMPVVDADPPRLASVALAHSDLTSTGAVVLAFTVPTDAGAGTRLPLIWAYGNVPPGSADPGAPLQQHLDSGPLLLSASTPLGAGNGTTPPPTTEPELPPLLPYQKLVLAHAVLFGVAFLALLPTGVLFARLLRTTSFNWFVAHWSIQFYTTAPIIAAAFLLGIVATAQQGSGHFNDEHKKLGLALVLLYVVQASLGALIHFVKNAHRARRPPQNYAHAVLGLTILALAFYQVRLGYTVEWPLLVGRPVPRAVGDAWLAWAIVFPLIYVAGLALVPRQYRIEAAAVRARAGAPEPGRSSFQQL